MRGCRLLVAFTLATVSLSAQANPVGSWHAVFVGPMGDRPKIVDAITFSIQSTPAGLTGVARAAEWPGDLVVTDLKFEGNRLSFTGTGKRGWSSSLPGGPMVYHCCPKLVFVGTIQGDEMKLEMTWTSTEVTDDPTARTVPMEAKRVAR
jgi:hypothetical protein